MNVRSRLGKTLSVRLFRKETEILESCQGLCSGIGKVLSGDRAGELAATAEKALGELRTILDAPPVKPLVSK